MTEQEFRRYILQFETEVIVQGIKKSLLTSRTGRVFIRSGRLAAQPFGKSMGHWIATNDPCAIDYYGYVKKSFGFSNLVDQASSESGVKPVAMDVPLVYFASVRVEKVALLAPRLVAGFPWFKIEVLNRRGFRHKLMEQK